MEYVNLGCSGLKVSRICLGTLTFGSRKWRPYMLDEAESRPIIERALELGVNFFDTADMYSLGVSEQILGRALNDMAVRSEVVIASKVYFKMSEDPNAGGLSRKHIMDAVEASLKRLGTDYLDLYQIHRWDYETPIEETLRALDDLVSAGKARYLGASSMFAWQFAKMLFTAERNGWNKFISMQNHYNLVYREEEREMMPLCLDHGVGALPWSPLARGFLAGNRSREGGGDTIRAKHDALAGEMYFRESDFRVVERVIAVAERHGASPAQIALAWLLHQPGVTAPIVGVRRIQHLEEAAEAAHIKLSKTDLAELEEPYEVHPILGHE
ncbi:MAG: aldo/keto reductase [Chloroflexota bacterium]|nr:MAG: aldo/keto reductase [Chloroflexota bacterium]